MEGHPPVSLPTLPVTSGPPAILLDTLLLIFLRLVYFFLSRRFLLSILNPTLRDLSKPETLLPSAASFQAEDDRPRSFNRSQSLNPLPENDYDTEDDDILSGVTPNSSYPLSPSKPNVSLPTSSTPSRDPFLRRNTDESFSHSRGESASLPSIPENGNGNIELQALGQKLKNVGAGMGKKVRVLQLSHARRGDAGVKGIKKATRGLSWLAR